MNFKDYHHWRWGPFDVCWVPDNTWGKDKVGIWIVQHQPSHTPFLSVAISPLVVHLYFGWFRLHWPYITIKGVTIGHED